MGQLIITENCVSAVFFPLADLRRKPWAAEDASEHYNASFPLSLHASSEYTGDLNIYPGFEYIPEI